MKAFKRILCLVLATLTFSTALVSCGKKDEQSGSNSDSTSASNSGSNSVDYNTPEEPPLELTNFTLVNNGQSDYKIVLADQTLYNERLAKDELIEFFYDATGIDLPYTTESKVTYNEDAKLIILGDTKFTQYSGVDADKIPTQGFTLKTVGSNLFIVGADYGVLYGAYEFLHQTFGYEVYAPDEVTMDRNVKNANMPLFDFSDSPDILFREANYGPQRYNVTAANRFRLHQNIWMTEYGNFVHNTFEEYFPKTTYEASNPKFYSTGGEQLCYTARGDSAQLQLMQDLTVERMKYLINKYYSQGDFRESLSFTQQDDNSWCTCSACNALKDKHGAQSATLIKFINPVAKRVREWLETAWPGHTVNIAIFAYFKAEAAPTKDIDSLKMEENVALFYAPFQTANYFYDFNHSKNSGVKATIDKWAKLTDNIYFWLYSTNFKNYLVWYDSFNSMQSLYQMTKAYGGNYLFDQGRYNAEALTGFDMLKCYLNAKLAWNVDANYQQLINNFFVNYFKDAAEPMLRYFNSFRSWSQYLKDNTSISGNVSTDTSSRSYWPKQVLVGWEDCINEAYKAIAPLQSKDKGLYEKLYDRIQKESIAIRYHLYSLYSNTYEETELKELRKQFKADATRLGFTKAEENKSIQDKIYSAWGV